METKKKSIETTWVYVEGQILVLLKSVSNIIQILLVDVWGKVIIREKLKSDILRHNELAPSHSWLIVKA